MSERRSSQATVLVLGDQLLRNHPALQAAEHEFERDRINIVLVESEHRNTVLPYHRRKLAMMLSAMRHYVDRLRTMGYRVDHRQGRNITTGLRQHFAASGSQRLFTMQANEYDARQWQSRLQQLLRIETTILPNTQFLGSQFQPFPDPKPGNRYVMENFYRGMRQHFRVLLDQDGSPAGGSWNYDAENRKPLPPGASFPERLAFKLDDITRQAIAEAEHSRDAIGSAQGFDLAVTHEQAERELFDFIENRLIKFGPYEDAMSTRDGVLYHSMLSAYVNIGLLEPMQMIRAAESAYLEGRAPLNSVEGFIRQILGWREFMYWQYWQQMPGLRAANDWKATRELPQFFWDGDTRMNCLRHAVGRVLDIGYAHHIERLMVICNFCLLAGVVPSQVAEWFLALYVDAFDWVVQPNVIGMGLNADGGHIGTKPYIASANYINKMSDYCRSCFYDHKSRTGENACPYNVLYWNFLVEHEEKLKGNPRLGPAVLGLKRVDPAERAAIRKSAKKFLKQLDDAAYVGATQKH